MQTRRGSRIISFFNRGGVLEGLVDRGIHFLLAVGLNFISNN